MLSFSAVYAVDIDMNIENENIQNNVSNDTIPRNEVSNNTTSPVSNLMLMHQQRLLPQALAKIFI